MAKESCRSTELKRCIRTEMRRKRNEVSLSSPDDARILLPRLDQKLDVDESKEPRFSTAID